MLPRQVLPRRFYLITRRCTQRQLLLRPDPATNNAFLYCLIAAALRCQIDVLLACAMSNHYHLVIYDRAGRYPEFIEHFHKLVARSQNALRGRWENFWASEQTCVVNLVDRNAVIDKLVYTATNPVLAHLVEGSITGPESTASPHCWRVDSSVRRARFISFGLMARCLMTSRYRSASHPSLDHQPWCSPSCANACAPSSSSGPASGCAPAVVFWADERCSRSRGASTRRVASPVGTCDRGSRREANGRGSRPCCAIATFAMEYADARARWRDGHPAAFPPGTYWLRRFASVPVLET
jgi:REP element-mobilizing transposase RayT